MKINIHDQVKAFGSGWNKNRNCIHASSILGNSVHFVTFAGNYLGYL